MSRKAIGKVFTGKKPPQPLQKQHKVGDLQVWWIPQVPMVPFEVDVASVAEGVKIMNILSDYDAFQFENKIKPDYCNTGGLRRWCKDDGDSDPGWEDWCDEETGEDNPRTWLEETSERGKYA